MIVCCSSHLIHGLCAVCLASLNASHTRTVKVLYVQPRSVTNCFYSRAASVNEAQRDESYKFAAKFAQRPRQVIEVALAAFVTPVTAIKGKRGFHFHWRAQQCHVVTYRGLDLLLSPHWNVIDRLTLHSCIVTYYIHITANLVSELS